MNKKDVFIDQAKALVVQKHQLDGTQFQVGKLDGALDAMIENQSKNEQHLHFLFAHVEAVIDKQSMQFEVEDENSFLIGIGFDEEDYESTVQPIIEAIPHIEIADIDDWQSYLNQVEIYAKSNQISFDKDPFRSLLTTSQRITLENRIKDEFSLKGASCDKYDYMIAGTCGLIGGLIDVFFVGLPGEGTLSQGTDDMTDQAVQKFASWNGWKGAREGKDSTASAIGFLENKYKVNYDHRHGGDVDRVFKMSTLNHHIKSLAHSPDLVGLFFSILAQFTSKAHFVDEGKLICVDTETFELKGSNLITKLFSGVVNWLGHLFSDVAGSSGAKGRGSGIPVPFFSLLQFVNVGEFGQHRQPFSKIAVQVFEQGYEFRHGIAMAIPVLVTEMLTRVTWALKQKFYHERTWSDCVPSANVPELRRMLLIAHGSLCLVDSTDAAIRSGGEMIQFMLRSNLLAWARFGTLALKEITVLYQEGNLDAESVDVYLEEEYRRILVGQ